MEKVNLAQKFSLFADHWSPKIIGELNDAYVKLVKLKGEFVWHHHEQEDELFLVVKGSLSRSKNCTVDCLVCGCLCETKHSADNAPLVKGLIPGPWLKTEGLPQTRPLYGTCRDATDSGSISGKFGSTESPHQTARS
jgi:hypothetical protein